ncbi:MAG: hypothetical protein RBJ76_25245 [Stenomitos frigidus ULC029]
MVRLIVRSLCFGWLAIALAAVFPGSSHVFPHPLLAADPPQLVLPVNDRESSIWVRALGKAKPPSPWRAALCDRRSKAPLLCVYDRQTLVGTVEMGTYLISSRADLRQKLVEAGIPAKADYATPQYRRQVTIALKAWVEEYYAFFKIDRQTEYGDSITFTAQPPVQMRVGRLTGLRYGFSGIKQGTNGIHEQHLGYVAFDGATLYVITTAFDAGSETGKFKTLEALQRFEPHLTRLVTALQLPIAKTSR